MVLKPLFTAQSLAALIELGEGQFLELKGTWDHARQPPSKIGKDKLRSVIAEYVSAFANADGGTLVIGVEDDGDPTGHGRSETEIADLIEVPRRRLIPAISCDHQLLELDGHEVLVIEVGRAPKAVRVSAGGYPYRSGDHVLTESEEWINSLKDNYSQAGVEQRISDALPSDVDLTLLPAAAADPVWLARRGLVLQRHGTPAVYNAAVLLAGRQPVTRWHRAQSVRLFRVDGPRELHGAERNVTQIERFELPVIELIPAAYELIRSQIRRSEKLHDLFFRELPEYPTFAWQEAVVNAVAHRDYADQGRGIEVWFYADRMEVRSPGLPMPPVTIEALAGGHAVHASRNPLMARVLVELGLMREEGEGIPRMFDEMERSFLHQPELAITLDGRFIVTLYNTPIFDTADESWRRLVERLTTNDAYRRVLLAHPGGFTNAQYRELNDVGRDEAYIHIQEMVNAGIVEPADRAGRGARYQLSPDLLTARAWLEQRLPVIAQWLAEHESLSNADYRQLFDVTRSVALAELRRLVDEGLLELRGERRGARYFAGRDLVH